MIYLAAPYSHENPEVEIERSKTIDSIAMNLIVLGYNIYSPITHGVAIKNAAILEDLELDTDWKAWKRHCVGMLKKADYCWILCLDGWKDSVGVQEEVKYCEQNKIPVDFYTYDDMLMRIAKGVD